MMGWLLGPTTQGQNMQARNKKAIARMASWGQRQVKVGVKRASKTRLIEQRPPGALWGGGGLPGPCGNGPTLLYW
eukprot:11204059-Lingulodinium_polyedra.AAC.1